MYPKIWKNEQNPLNTKIFQDDQKILSRDRKGEITVKDTPMIEEVKSFWCYIWCHKKLYNKKARRIDNIKDTYKNTET